MYIALGLVELDHSMKADVLTVAPSFFSTLHNQYIMEIWKDIEDYEGIYQISNLGKLKSFKGSKEMILNPGIKSTGYVATTLCKQSTKYVRIHRLVANAFIPNPENKPCINHKNGIKHDNRAENLEWCTYSENMLHAYKTGLKKHHYIGKTGKDHCASRPIIQYSMTGEKIDEHESQMNAERKTGIRHEYISRSCRGKVELSSGYIWRFKNELS